MGECAPRGTRTGPFTIVGIEREPDGVTLYRIKSQTHEHLAHQDELSGCFRDQSSRQPLQSNVASCLSNWNLHPTSRRKRAEEVRKLAELIEDRFISETLLDIARQYEEVAERAERLLRPEMTRKWEFVLRP